MHQNSITAYKTITYISIIIFTNVKNIRQIRLFMQNKPKVKIGKIKPNPDRISEVKCLLSVVLERCGNPAGVYPALDGTDFLPSVL
jgi:hypothetical protein